MTLQQLTLLPRRRRARLVQPAAARALYLAQPSLSEQVRALESELGVDPLRARRPRCRPHRGRPRVPARGRARARRPRGGPRGRRRGARAARRHAQHRDVRHRVGLPALRLVADFRTRTPTSRCGSSARTPQRSPRMCARGRLEAALVVLPVDDDGLERPAGAARGSRLHQPRAGARARADHDRAPRRVAADPLRRPLRLERPDPPPAPGAGAAGRRLSSSR